MSSESIVSVLPGETISKRMRHILSRAPAILLLFTIYTQLDDQGHWRFLFHVFFYVVFIYMLQHSSASSQKHRNSTSSSYEWAHLLLLCIPRWDASISDDDVLSLTWTLPKFCAVDVILLNRCRYSIEGPQKPSWESEADRFPAGDYFIEEALCRRLDICLWKLQKLLFVISLFASSSSSSTFDSLFRLYLALQRLSTINPFYYSAVLVIRIWSFPNDQTDEC